MSYKKALEKIKNLDNKQLVANAYMTCQFQGDPCFCALGALIPEIRAFHGESIITIAFHLGKIKDGMKTSERLQGESLGFDSVGMTVLEMCRLQKDNDYFLGGRNDEPARMARYQYILGWLEDEVAEEEPSNAKWNN